MKGKVNKVKTLSEKDLKSALIKKALGYDATEIVEEYVGDNEGQIVLSKKKITTKNVPPDISAIKILFETQIQPIAQMSDQELQQEKERLIELLKKENLNKKE